MKKNLINILLIEDDEDDFLLFKRFLDKAVLTEYRIDWQSTYEHALGKVLEKKHDVYFIDYRMGKHTGVELLNDVRGKMHDKPLIMLTGQDVHSIALEAIKAGAEDYLIKGQITTALLEKAIFYALERKQTSLEREQDAQREAEREILEKRKDEFISMASHELKTPLTSQKLFISTLQKIVKDLPDKRPMEITDKIIRQTEKLEKLVKDLLDVSKIQAGQLDFDKLEVDLNELVANIVEDIQGTTSHKIKVRGGISQKICADKDKITQVLTNLLTNAIKYSPKIGDINIEIQEEEDKCKISIQDYGIGIDKEHQDKIFNRFFRVDGKDEKTFPGMGVGLYISSQIIEKHNGRIWVESTKGEGTIFYFTLPIV